MRALLRRFTDSFTIPTRENEDLYKEWDRLREQAISPSERAEIDAIFARNL